MKRLSAIFNVLIILSIAFCISPSASVAGVDEESLYQEARASYYELSKSAKLRKYRHNWIKVIERYKKVYSEFPGGKRGDAALYMAAKTFVELMPYSGQRKELRNSNEILEILTSRYPESSLVDDSYKMMALNYEKLADKRKAYGIYKIIVEKYKKGDQLKNARARLKVLKAYAPQSKPVKVRKAKNNKSRKIKKKGKSKISFVTNIRHWSNPNYTRIVIDLDRPAKYEAHLLKKDPSIGKPPRLYIDIFGARKKETMQEEVPIDDGLLKRARAGQHDGSTVRVVFDIESIKDFKIFPMFDPYRIVIDVRGDEPSPSIEALLPRLKKEMKGLKSEKASLSRQLGLGVRKIVIDAGHGGRDPGAIGYRGTKEKDVTLRVAKALKRKLEKSYGYQVVLTRNDDRYLQLEERTVKANLENADLFISIHANANKSRKAYGMETYVMNARATDRFASEVAARENAVTTNSMGEFGSILEGILVDMQKTNKVNESNKLAASVQGHLSRYMSKKYKRIKNLGVKRGPFYVLIGANMPSILIETGFISNKREEQRLKNKKYIAHMVTAISLGIYKYADLIKTASIK